jgi:hypothetical protein
MSDKCKENRLMLVFMKIQVAGYSSSSILVKDAAAKTEFTAPSQVIRTLTGRASDKVPARSGTSSSCAFVFSCALYFRSESSQSVHSRMKIQL